MPTWVAIACLMVPPHADASAEAGSFVERKEVLIRAGDGLGIQPTHGNSYMPSESLNLSTSPNPGDPGSASAPEPDRQQENPRAPNPPETPLQTQAGNRDLSPAASAETTAAPSAPSPPPADSAQPPLTSEEKRRRLEAEALPLMDLVYSVARRMVGDEAKAEDLTQETFLRAFRSNEQYTLGTNCKAWLLTILRSVYIDASRHVQARGGTHEQLPHDVFAPNERTDLPIDAARFMSILDVMVDDDIRDAMLHVPELYREAFVMVVIAELPYKEAALVLGVQEGTVKSRVFRACQMLKGKLWNYAVERRIAKNQG